MNKTASASSQAQDGIVEFIKDKGLTSGDPLPSEAILCEQLGFSRTSIRQAIHTLSSLDIIEVRHGHGTFVSNMSLQPLIKGMILRTTLGSEKSLETLDEIVELRSAIDHSLANELVDTWKGQDISEITAIVDDMRAQHENGKPFHQQDKLFHQKLLEPTHNSIMKELSDAFWEIHMALMPRLEVVMPGDINITIQAHASMIEALQVGNTERYQQLVDEHYAPLRRTIANARR